MTPAPPPQATANTEPLAPTFDLVRIEPSGESVIAGRGARGAMVEMLRNGEVFARTIADQSGLFALVPPLLPPGSHDLVLQSVAPNGVRARSRESVTVAIAQRRDQKPLVALTSPNKPTVVLSTPDTPRPPAPEQPGPSAEAGGGAPPSGEGEPRAAPAPAGPPATRGPVKVASVEAEEGGRLFVSGQGPAGATVRLYLNETFIAPGSAGADGRVSFAIGRGVVPGSYRVRLDEVDPVSGEVKSRAEVVFAVPATVTVPLPPAAAPYVTQARRAPTADQPAVSHPQPAEPPPRAVPPAPDGIGAEPGGGAAAPLRELDANTILIPEITTAIVSRGDNLWTISRRIYGSGVRYTTIYGANQEQIRNPNLIYPGQTFVLPPEGAPSPTR